MLVSGLYKLGRGMIKGGRLIEKNGKPNIPRYLYHVTSKENYDSMLKCGFIKTNPDKNPACKLDGVFMFDMQNFAKRWANTQIYFGDYRLNLASALLLKNACNTIGKNTNIVLLRIPTKNMDIGKLKIRPQYFNSGIINGDSAMYKSIYTRRKNSIEYIYEENIKIQNVQNIGDTSIKVNTPEDILCNPFDILKKLVKGQPEENCITKMQNVKIKPQIIKWD